MQLERAARLSSAQKPAPTDEEMLCEKTPQPRCSKIKKYNQILTSTSRGFDTKYEFLESWVPSTDLTQSVSDLVNSALDYDITELEIIFLEKELENLNISTLEKKFNNICNINLIIKKLIIKKK